MIILFGAGNQSKYTADILHKSGEYDILITNWPADLSGVEVTKGIVTIGDNYSRDKVRQSIEAVYPHIEWVNAIHPSCIIGENVKFGNGIVAMAGCIFNPGAVIGDFAFFATGAQIEHDCKIGEFASVSAGSVLGGHVTVEPFSALTLNCTVFDRLTIGRNAVVGSGAVVTKDVEADTVVYGNPAKFVRRRSEGERFLK